MVTVNGREMSQEIRHPEITRMASELSARMEVRRVLTEKQRRLAARGGLVAEGRDMGTVVFPQAEYKFYLRAISGRPGRTTFPGIGSKAGYASYWPQVEEEIDRRDRQDSGRALAPLRPAAGAEIIDTSQMSIASRAGHHGGRISLRVPRERPPDPTPPGKGPVFPQIPGPKGEAGSEKKN